MTNRMPARGAGSRASVVAVDLGAQAVRVVEVDWAGDTEGHIARRGTAPLPPNAWTDLPASIPGFAAAIREAISAAGINARAVVAALPRRLVTLRFARLPHAPPDQMRSMVTFEAQQYILFSMDEVIMDYYVVPELSGFGSGGGDDMEVVLLAAARRSLIADIMAIFDRAGLELERLSISALALAEHARGALEPTALIDLEAGEMDVAVVGEGRLLYTRATALEVTNAHPDVASRRIGEEVARSFTAYQNEYRQRPLSHIYVVGTAGGDRDQTERMLSEMLEMPVGHLQSRLLPPGEAAYATAVGAALQTRPGSIGPINLVPNERAERKVQAAKKQRNVLAAVAGVAVLLAGGVFVQKQLAARRKLEADTLRANQRLNEKLEELSDVQKTYNQVKALDADLVQGMEREHPVIDILFALDKTLPKNTDVWLTQLSMERGGLITIKGESKSETAVTDIVMALQDSGAFSEVKLGYMGDSQSSDPVSATSNRPSTTTAPKTTNPPPNAGTPNPPPSGSNPAPPPGLRGGPPGMGRRLPGKQAIPDAPPGAVQAFPVPAQTPVDRPAPGPPPGVVIQGRPGPLPGGPVGNPVRRVTGPVILPSNGHPANAVPANRQPVGTPSMTAPGTGTVSATGATAPGNGTSAAVTAPPTSRVPRTSFVITCRINPKAKDLIPKKWEEKTLPKAGATPSTPATTAPGPKETNSEETEEGADDGA